VHPEHFAAASVVVPAAPILDAFERITMPFRDLIASVDRESRKLAELRDYLLPKLLSGEVRVRKREEPGLIGAPRLRPRYCRSCPPTRRGGSDCRSTTEIRSTGCW
jgi:hypothetical protein